MASMSAWVRVEVEEVDVVGLEAGVGSGSGAGFNLLRQLVAVSWAGGAWVLAWAAALAADCWRAWRARASGAKYLLPVLL